MNWQYIGSFSASAFCGLLFAILLGRTALVSFRRLTDWVRNCPIRAVVLAPLVGFLVVYAETDNTKTTSLWKIDPAAAPAFALDTGAAPIVDTKAQIVQGANLSFPITLTSKKGDKAKYVIDLVWQGDCYLAGQVIRTWKDGKESKTAYGVADLIHITN